MPGAVCNDPSGVGRLPGVGVVDGANDGRRRAGESTRKPVSHDGGWRARVGGRASVDGGGNLRICCRGVDGKPNVAGAAIVGAFRAVCCRGAAKHAGHCGLIVCRQAWPIVQLGRGDGDGGNFGRGDGRGCDVGGVNARGALKVARVRGKECGSGNARVSGIHGKHGPPGICGVQGSHSKACVSGVQGGNGQPGICRKRGKRRPAGVQRESGYVRRGGASGVAGKVRVSCRARVPGEVCGKRLGR